MLIDKEVNITISSRNITKYKEYIENNYKWACDNDYDKVVSNFADNYINK